MSTHQTYRALQFLSPRRIKFHFWRHLLDALTIVPTHSPPALLGLHVFCLHSEVKGAFKFAVTAK